ncbi:hypothetical protein BROUX41_000285 [Berkeleyomyces rouxiae]
MASSLSANAFSGAASPLESRDSSAPRQPISSTPRNTPIAPSRVRTNPDQPLPASVSSSYSSTTAQQSHKPPLRILSPSKPQRSSIYISNSPSPSPLPSPLPSVLSPPFQPTVSEARRDGPPRWPVSPRIRPPPLAQPQPAPSHTAYPVHMQRANQPATTASRYIATFASEMSESDTDDPQTPSGLRTPTMKNPNQLATVQEINLPNSPGPAASDTDTNTAMIEIHDRFAARHPQEEPQTPNSQDSDAASADSVRTVRARNAASYPDDDATTTYNDGRKSSLPVAQPPLMSRQSSTFSTFNKTKPTTDGSSMIVESETVTSVPQLSLAAVPQGSGGTLRAMPSTETIRPKKDRKKQTRKQPMNPDSSKAEIFEYKVASAVDDSDSDETFVYDSNPHDGPRRYHHSRTPSTTSMASQIDRPMRSIHSVIDAPGPSTSSKKNMKFANSFNNATDPLNGDDDGRASNRSNIGLSRNSARIHNHHMNRYGRAHNSHTSLFDSESPFINPARAKMHANSRQNSGPPSPRYMTSRSQTNRQAASCNLSNVYDLDEAAPDDERTPLVPYSSRQNRAGRQSRRGQAQRHIESQTYRSRPSALNRLAACLVVTMMVLVVITGAIGFMFATSQPLTDIELIAIENVLASEPELMFDLTIRAHNPNIVVVTIDNANLEIFAKSVHAGTDADWYKNPKGNAGNKFKTDALSNVIHVKDDPPEDMPDETAPNMRLGTIQEFDSPLSFEGLFFHKGLSVSTGGVRLPLPGNSTAGGSERWGKVIQDDFDLIVKGIIKYYLPLSQRMRSVSISGRARVKPNSATNPSLKPNMTTTGPTDS